MWCKASSRKHKRWEGDAVLVARGRTVVLKDMEGRDIGRGAGYKASELESLCEGQTLMVGGKQIEVMGVISDEDYAKGRCFQNAAVETPAETVLKAPVYRPVSKSFTKPALKGGALTDSEPEKPICKPRHDLNAPGALVMPRPTTDHQWLYNKSGSPLVDVVIDPHLTNHLRPHQKEGVVFLYECLMGMRLPGRCGAILADEMGLGKTLQCVCVLWTLLRQGPYGGRPVLKRALVVCPGSLVKNWAAEFNKWLGRERISVYTVDQDHRVEDFVSSPLCSVMVISYEMLLRSVDQLKELEFGVLICDEGHRLKNSNIKTAGALTALSCERRLILTGTPVQNDLQEFYSIIEFVNPGILGTSAAYRKIYEEPILRSRQPTCTEEERCIGEERAAELFRLTGVFTLRRTQEIINQYLSERIEWTVFCKPTELQLRLYGVLLATRPIRACLSGARTHTYTHSPHLACINALKKLCNHPGLLYNTLQEKSDEMFEDGIMELFPEGYSTGAFSTADSGKLLVLTDLLSAIQHVNRTDRYHIYNCCPTSLQTSSYLKGFHIKKLLQLLTNLINEKENVFVRVAIYTEELTTQSGKNMEQIKLNKVIYFNIFGFVKEIEEDTGRACQLGRHCDSTASFPQRVSMSELMHWRHFSGDVQSYDDIYLNHARNNITYAFQSTTSKSQTTV
uniref:RAD54 homolog B n=1 Tax=Cyprinus carpio TaxID=7962 RepID=A0A8C1R7H0_CYPCA